MRIVTDHPASPKQWRGAVAFALDHVVPLLGFASLTIGAFHLPGAWGSVGGWAVAGAATIYVRHLLQPDIDALKQRAQADRIDLQRARAREMRAVA